MELTTAIWNQLRRLDFKKQHLISVNGRNIQPSTMDWWKNTETNSTWIKRIEYTPVNNFKGFVVVYIKTIQKRANAKGEIKTYTTKGGQLTIPVSFKQFVVSLASPNNVNNPSAPDGVGTKLWTSVNAFIGVSQEEGGEGEQAKIVQTFKAQKQLSGKSYEKITEWIQAGKVDKLQRTINRQAMIKRKYSPDQLLTMFLRQLRF